jgi:hypothetical protein
MGAWTSIIRQDRAGSWSRRKDRGPRAPQAAAHYEFRFMDGIPGSRVVRSLAAYASSGANADARVLSQLSAKSSRSLSG